MGFRLFYYKKKIMKKSLAIILGVIICLSVGWLSRMIHAESMEVWYPTLEKSGLTPPDLTFVIVWGVLYVLMGISIGLFYPTNDSNKEGLLWLFGIQLLLNISWNYLFFYLQNPLLGLVNLLILDVLAILFFMGVLRIMRSSAILFLPYMVWMFFATYLNFYIFLHN